MKKTITIDFTTPLRLAVILGCFAIYMAIAANAMLIILKSNIDNTYSSITVLSLLFSALSASLLIIMRVIEKAEEE